MMMMMMMILMMILMMLCFLLKSSSLFAFSLIVLDILLIVLSCDQLLSACIPHKSPVISFYKPPCLTGTWSHGRLGLGPIPLERAPKKGMRAGAKKTARYQLHPRRWEDDDDDGGGGDTSDDDDLMMVMLMIPTW